MTLRLIQGGKEPPPRGLERITADDDWGLNPSSYELWTRTTVNTCGPTMDDMWRAYRRAFQLPIIYEVKP